MAGNTFVEITQEKVIENPIHFLANPQIGMKSMQVEKGFFVANISGFTPQFILATSSVHGVPMVQKFELSNSKDPNYWTDEDGDEFVVYGTSPD
jgi:hypothetical protein